jgi:hypothetical protein
VYLFFGNKLLLRIQKSRNKSFASFNFDESKYIPYYSKYQHSHFHFFNQYSRSCSLSHNMFFLIFGIQHNNQSEIGWRPISNNMPVIDREVNVLDMYASQLKEHLVRFLTLSSRFNLSLKFRFYNSTHSACKRLWTQFRSS